MTQRDTPKGAEIRIRTELLEGRSIQSVADGLGMSYNSIAKRYRKLVEMGEIEDKVKHPYSLRIPEELKDFLNLKRNEYFEYPISEKEDCEYTVAFLNEKCVRPRSNGRFGRFIHKWTVKVIGNKVRIIKTW